MLNLNFKTGDKGSLTRTTQLLCLIASLGVFTQVLAEPITKEKKTSMPITTQQLIESLDLEAHVEGGYFRRTFQADHRDKVDTEFGERFTLTSIYYLLTQASPVGHWHLNRSDIIHYYHLGSPIDYYLLDAQGKLTKTTMGPDPTQGHQLQLVVKGGTWKASHLIDGDYGLICEAVAPGFDFNDMTLGDTNHLLELFPQHSKIIKQFSRHTQ